MVKQVYHTYYNKIYLIFNIYIYIMSSGSVLQLQSNENVVFVRNPQITYFKSVYRRHTKFAIVDHLQTSATPKNHFDGTEGEIRFSFPSQGDLLSQISLQINKRDELSNFPGTPRHIPSDITTKLFKEIKLFHDDIPDPIDSLRSEYINFYSSLNNKKSINATYDIIEDELVCVNGNNHQQMSLCGGVINSLYHTGNKPVFKKLNIILPIPFSFTKNTGTALPLFMLTDRQKFNIEITNMASAGLEAVNLFNNGVTTPPSEQISAFKYSLIYKFIYLSEEEKRRFKSSNQDYLLEKVKYKSSNQIGINTSTNINIKAFAPNLPIKSIFIVNNSTSGYKDFSYNFSIRGVNFQQEHLPHEFYSKVNISEYFKGCVYKQLDNNVKEDNTIIDNRIAYVQFSLKNSEGPSGCINTGTNELSLSINTSINQKNIDLYIVYYSILRFTDTNNLSFPYHNY